VLLAGAYAKHDGRLSKFGHKTHAAGTRPVTAVAGSVNQVCRLLRVVLHSKAALACSFHRWTFTPLTISHSSSGISPRAAAEAM
jgi:hypothetical protein